jgi:hypothetical protein
MAIQLCKYVDVKNSAARYMMRMHACQHEFRMTFAVPYRYDISTFVRSKRNIYNNLKTNTQHIMQFYSEEGLLRTRVDGTLAPYLIRFSSSADIEDACSARECWRNYSEFAIYYTDDCSSFYLESLANIPFSDRNAFPHSQTSFSRNFHNYYYLILSWFDRLDRMIFWKCFAKVCLSSNKFCGKSQTVDGGLCLELAVFILGYL